MHTKGVICIMTPMYVQSGASIGENYNSAHILPCGWCILKLKCVWMTDLFPWSHYACGPVCEHIRIYLCYYLSSKLLKACMVLNLVWIWCHIIVSLSIPLHPQGGSIPSIRTLQGTCHCCVCKVIAAPYWPHSCTGRQSTAIHRYTLSCTAVNAC